MTTQRLSRIAAVIFSSAFALSASAATVTVLKVKGNKGIVKFDGVNPKRGDKLTIGGGGDEGDMGGESLSEAGEATGHRKYTLDLSFGFARTSIPVDENTTSSSFGIDLGGKFGWNFGSIELGPSLGFAKAGATHSFNIGAFGEYNFIKNVAPANFIPGLVVDASFTKPSAGSQLDFGGGVFGKFFVFGTSTALRADLTFALTKTSTDAASSTSTKMGLAGGLQTYF
jgi:hypothetical protein